MNSIVQFVGSSGTLQLFGVRLVGLNSGNARKLLLSVILIGLVILIARVLRWISRALLGERTGPTRFWVKQVIGVLQALLLITGVVSIWFNNPSQLASAAAFITAGLAIASQRVITALSAYLIILRGKTFQVGDRIVMGGVRGDVVNLGFMQTTIMEMGQAPGESADAPSVWVASRQYTGRLVVITNDKIFDTPVYNYTREFPYIWEEMHIPIPYDGDLKNAERIIVEAARHHTSKITELSEDALRELERRYAVKREQLEPRVYCRLTDNWVELAVRFVVEDHGVRTVKDAISREILQQFEGAKIGIASGTYQVVGFPELKVRLLADVPGANQPSPKN